MHINETTAENESLTKRKSALGVRLFFIYLIFYAGFVLIGVVVGVGDPQLAAGKSPAAVVGLL